MGQAIRPCAWAQTGPVWDGGEGGGSTGCDRVPDVHVAVAGRLLQVHCASQGALRFRQRCFSLTCRDTLSGAGGEGGG